jgi:hypothetical protein
LPHILPPRAYVTGETVDPDDLNEVFQEVAGKLAGRLNEHDISIDNKTKIAVSAEAYYGAHHIVRASDPNFTRGAGAYAQIDSVAGDAVATVADTEGWQALVDEGGSQDMSLTLTTGEDVLVMFAMAQHFGWKGSDTAVAAEIGSPLRLQYALRVDGALLDDTITGAALYPDPPAQPWYRATTTTNDFDYRHIQYLRGTTGISCAAHPTRITRSLPVVAGSHVVEMVARRLPPADYKVDNDGEGATVQIFNRRLFILRLKGVSPHAGGAPSVNISAFEDGQVVAAADITTNGFTALATAANTLNNSNLERGALHNEHLPSVIHGPRVKLITPASPTTVFSGVYPGYGALGVGVWTVINDGLGNTLDISGPAPTFEWDLVDNPGMFVVIANVEVDSIVWNPQADNIQAIGILALRITNSLGTVSVIGETEVYINAHNPDPEVANTMRSIKTDAPLMWVVDSADLTLANRHITLVEVVGSVWDADGVAAVVQVDMRTQRGCLYAFVLKDVHT